MRAGARRRRSGAPVAAALALAAVTAAGCDDGFSLLGPPGAPVAVFGVLDAAADTQLVRLDLVRRTPVPAAASLDGLAATLAADGGPARAGTPVALPLRDGTVAAAVRFLAPVAPGTRQRLTLTLPDGTTAEATTDVPPGRPATVEPAARDSAGRVRQAVVWAGFAGSPQRSVVRYRLLPPDAPDTVVVAVAPREGRPTAGGWRSVVGLLEDRPAVFEALRRPQADTTVRLLSVEVELAERSAEWGAAGQEAPPNLTGAYGFFGALGVSRVRFLPDAATLRALRYRR